MPPLKHTPYYHKFLELGAELSDRPGFIVAQWFTSIEEEHKATREAAGLYDVYSQGPIDVKGKDAHALLNRLVVNDLDRLSDNQVIYTSFCNEQGGMLDDLTCYRFSPEHYWVIATPSRVATIEQRITEHARGLCAHVTNTIPGTAYLSVQGPKSREILSGITAADLSTAALPYYHLVSTTVAEVPVILSRTGYSGELGYELYYSRDYGEYMWDALMAAGADYGLKPAGLGALITTRVEKKYPLFGLDISEGNTPVEAGLGWTVRLDKKSDYSGRAVIQRQKEEGVTRRLVGFELPDLSYVPARDDTIWFDGREVGKVTSAGRGLTLGKALALGYVAIDVAKAGTTVTLRSAAGEDYPAIIHTKAFYDPDLQRIRA